MYECDGNKSQIAQAPRRSVQRGAVLPMAAAAPEPDAAYAAAAPVRSTDSTPLGDLSQDAIREGEEEAEEERQRTIVYRVLQM